MRKDYPLSSQEINDRIENAYANIVAMLGYKADSYTQYSGLYNKIEASGVNIINSSSGVPLFYDSDASSKTLPFYIDIEENTYKTGIRFNTPRKWGQ